MKEKHKKHKRLANMKQTIDWAENFLQENGYKIVDPLQIVQNTPYSSVVKFSTDRGIIYLKKTPPELSVEPTVIKILYEQCHADVPSIIITNKTQCCFLMQDAGIPLHDFFKKAGFQTEVFVRIIQNYTQMQINTVDKIPQFLNNGVPDWRLNQLQTRYEALIVQESLLLADGLTKNEIKKLYDLRRNLSEILDQLSQYNIPSGFGHGDFHGKNILVNPDTHKTTIIDLGEVVITHPFFSLQNCLHITKENFAIPDDQYQKLQKACFKNWLAFESSKNLFEILSIIERCWSIHSVLVEYRLMQSVDVFSLQKLKRKGRLARNFRHWLSQY
jgi:hypothetical protein